MMINFWQMGFWGEFLGIICGIKLIFVYFSGGNKQSLMNFQLEEQMVMVFNNGKV